MLVMPPISLSVHERITLLASNPFFYHSRNLRTFTRQEVVPTPHSASLLSQRTLALAQCALQCDTQLWSIADVTDLEDGMVDSTAVRIRETPTPPTPGINAAVLSSGRGILLRASSLDANERLGCSL